MNYGKLIGLAKSFGAANTEGRDAAEMLRQSLENSYSSFSIHSLSWLVLPTINDTRRPFITFEPPEEQSDQTHRSYRRCNWYTHCVALRQPVDKDRNHLRDGLQRGVYEGREEH